MSMKDGNGKRARAPETSNPHLNAIAYPPPRASRSSHHIVVLSSPMCDSAHGRCRPMLSHATARAEELRRLLLTTARDRVLSSVEVAPEDRRKLKQELKAILGRVNALKIGTPLRGEAESSFERYTCDAK